MMSCVPVTIHQFLALLLHILFGLFFFANGSSSNFFLAKRISHLFSLVDYYNNNGVEYYHPGLTAFSARSLHPPLPDTFYEPYVRPSGLGTRILTGADDNSSTTTITWNNSLNNGFFNSVNASISTSGFNSLVGSNSLDRAIFSSSGFNSSDGFNFSDWSNSLTAAAVYVTQENDGHSPSANYWPSLLLAVSHLFRVENLQIMLSYILNGYATLLCVIMGIILNALCIFVFTRCHRRGASGAPGTPIIQIYLVTLTIWQSALLLNAFLLYCLPTLLYGHIVSEGNYVFLYPFAYALANTTHTGTVWVILALTIDRYLALCQPLKHRAIGKQNRVRKLMVGVSVSAILFSLPRFFEVTTVQMCLIPEEVGNSSTSSTGIGTGGWAVLTGADGEQTPLHCVPTVSRTSLPENEAYWTVYHIVLALLFVTLVPCLLLFALTVRISMALRRAQIQRRKMTMPSGALLCDLAKTTTAHAATTTAPQQQSNGVHNQANGHGGGGSGSKDVTPSAGGWGANVKNVYSRKEHMANIMLVVVIAKFLASDILPTVLDVTEQLLGNQAFMMSYVATLCVDFSNFLLVLNCSTNFWVFLLWGRRFRRSCADLLRRWLHLSWLCAAGGSGANGCSGVGPGSGKRRHRWLPTHHHHGTSMAGGGSSPMSTTNLYAYQQQPSHSSRLTSSGCGGGRSGTSCATTANGSAGGGRNGSLMVTPMFGGCPMVGAASAPRHSSLGGGWELPSTSVAAPIMENGGGGGRRLSPRGSPSPGAAGGGGARNSVATTSPYRQPPPQKEARDDPTEQGGPADQDASSPLLPNPAADQDQQNDHGQQRQEGNVVERKVTNVAAVTSPLLSVSPTAAPEVDEEDETFLETESPTTTTAANGRSAISLPPSSCNGASGRSRRTLIDGNGAKSGVAKHEQLLEQLIEFV